MWARRALRSLVVLGALCLVLVLPETIGAGHAETIRYAPSALPVAAVGPAGPGILGGLLVLLLVAGLAWGWRRTALRLQRVLRYESLFERGHEPLFLLDDTLSIVEANPAAVRLLDRPPTRLRGRPLLSLIEAGEDVESYILKGTVEQKGAVSIEATVKRDGRVIHLEGRLNAVEEGRYLATLHDVTFSQERFRLYESFLERLLDEMPVEVSLLSPDGRYRYVNPNAVREAHVREWILGKTDFDLCEEYGLHPEVALRRRSFRRQATETRQPVTFEEILPDASGTERRILRTYSPHLSPEGDVTVVAAFGLDATEVRALQQELQSARAESEKMTRFKELFLQNMSHELRTPITGIVGFAQILKEEVPEPLQEFIINIEQNARRLMDTLGDMLDLAGLRAENIDLEPRLVDLAEAARESVRPLRARAEEKGLFLTVKASETDTLVRLDPAALHRILHNLIENAVKFTAEGGVVVEVAQERGQALLRVMDSGVGIDRGFIGEAFEEFRQEEPGLERSFEGLGLGLSVTRQLVRRMGGEIQVQSDKGQGTMFTISFPAVFAATTAFEGDRPQVLVVDANAETRRLVEHHLGRRFRVTKCATVEEGVEEACKTPHDVILLDVRGGVEAGQLLAGFRQLPGYDRVPILAVDAERAPGNLARYRKAGFDQHLAKPFDRLSLLDALMEALPENSPALR